MAYKDRLNGLLSSATGYRLTRGRREAAVIEAQRRRIEALERRRRKIPPDIDDAARQTIIAVRPWTMTGHDKLFDLIQSVRYVSRYGVAGDIVECGVWRGGSMQAVARTLLEVGDTSRDLHLFDTFEGMPPPTDQDRRRNGRSAAELLEATDRSHTVWAYATLDDVRSGLARIPYPAEKLHFVAGKVEDTIPQQMPERIAILRLDTDWYESTDHELRHMYDRLVPGGVLMLDDYGSWEGARKATDEFLERTGEPLLLLRMGSGRVAVKPRR